MGYSSSICSYKLLSPVFYSLFWCKGLKESAARNHGDIPSILHFYPTTISSGLQSGSSDSKADVNYEIWIDCTIKRVWKMEPVSKFLCLTESGDIPFTDLLGSWYPLCVWDKLGIRLRVPECMCMCIFRLVWIYACLPVQRSSEHMGPGLLVCMYQLYVQIFALHVYMSMFVCVGMYTILCVCACMCVCAYVHAWLGW